MGNIPLIAVAVLVGGLGGYALQSVRHSCDCKPSKAAAAAPVNEATFIIDGAALDAALNDPDLLARGARVVPFFQDGKVTGFKVFAIPPDSQAAKYGLQEGDVVTRLNEVELNEPGNTMSALMTLRGATAIDLDLNRGGSPLRLHYTVRR